MQPPAYVHCNPGGSRKDWSPTPAIHIWEIPSFWGKGSNDPMGISDAAVLQSTGTEGLSEVSASGPPP